MGDRCRVARYSGVSTTRELAVAQPSLIALFVLRIIVAANRFRNGPIRTLDDLFSRVNSKISQPENYYRRCKNGGGNVSGLLEV